MGNTTVPEILSTTSQEAMGSVAVLLYAIFVKFKGILFFPVSSVLLAGCLMG